MESITRALPDCYHLQFSCGCPVSLGMQAITSQLRTLGTEGGIKRVPTALICRSRKNLASHQSQAIHEQISMTGLLGSSMPGKGLSSFPPVLF